MSRTEVWGDSDDRAVKIVIDWPARPSVEGDSELAALVDQASTEVADDMTALGAIGPGSWTRPDLDARLETKLVAAGLAKQAYERHFDLAENHLKTAVRQAQEATEQQQKALEMAIKLSAIPQDDEPSDSPNGGRIMDGVMFSVHSERMLDASRTAVILAVASLEAFINQIAVDAPGWLDDMDRLSFLAKWKVVPQLMSAQTFDEGTDPFQSLRKLNKLRNNLVHGKPIDRYVAIDGSATDADAFFESATARPDWDVSRVSGRWACWVVREVVMHFCQLTGTPVPGYLVYVPPTDPTDINAWRSASLLTGLRDDPDFPKRPPFWLDSNDNIGSNT